MYLINCTNNIRWSLPLTICYYNASFAGAYNETILKRRETIKISVYRFVKNSGLLKSN